MARGRGRPADLPSLPLQAATLAKPPPSGWALPSLLWLLAKRQRCPPGPGSPMAPGGGRLLLASGCARPARPAPGLELCPLGPRGPETRCFLPSAEPAPGLAVLAGPVEVPPPHPGGGRCRCVLSAEPTAQLGGTSHVPGAELPVCARAPSSSRAGSAVATPAALPPAHPVGDRDAPGVC